jgi:DNA polymerase-1
MYKETQYHGVCIDEKLRQFFSVVWGVKYLKDEQELIKIAQDEGWEGEILLSSNPELGKFLFDVLSLPIIKRTKTSARSVDKEVLEALKYQHPFVEKLLDFRHLSKMLSTYIFQLPNQLKEDGKAHPIVKLHGTGTGRPSYSGLAIQTFPVPFRDPGTFGRMRELVIPVPSDDPNDPTIIVEVDYGKAEIWQAYSYSQDPQIYEDLMSGDYHRSVAAFVKKKPISEITSQERDVFKKVNFGVLYDMEPPTLSKRINDTVVVAADYIQGYFRRNKGYRKWFLDTQAAIKREGELVSLTGRKRRIIILGSAVRAVKQAVNFPIQSTASDCVLDSAVEVHHKLKEIGSHILFTVHDSIVAQTKRSKLEQTVRIMHDAMIAERFPGVSKMPVEVKVGTSWGTVKGIHDCTEHDKPNQYGISLESICLWPKK